MSLRLPRVDRILDHPALASSPALRSIQKRYVNDALADLRRRALAGEISEAPEAEAIARAVARRLAEVMTPRPRALINATGVLLHTNLGRAPLSREAVAAMTAAAGTCELEFEVESGRRGSRLTWLRPLLAALLGAEDVHVVNNGAAALLLACTAVGRPGGVALSRGQMVEIGDGFRVAEMAAAGGAALWEIGSTNRTHVADYAAALTGELPGQSGPVAAILWVHLSNFSQAGFVHQPELAELAALGRARGVPLLADLGSGSLGGIPGEEPTVQEYLSQGADLVTCSGDKLLGGPQAGILAGSAALVGRCRRHPLARALRPDKTTVAALHATALAYASGQADTLPLRRMIGWSEDQLRARAEALAARLGWPPGQVRASVATVGGGSLPGDTMASVALAVPTRDPSATAAALRHAGVVGRVHAGELLLDLRTVAPEEDEALIAAVRDV
ncbi:L-seryl-tRNA(Sec) selenium transferase [Nannocystis radixulma]|uniref:L-seryl-tRNA(Sec) selenium transferase n=1 Tax=Nannocystis radixulma TaxID=2995305 RepID=A0ABT5AW63_9BACT|nr:L-seryl-tRNA(Sec) selenium transferase [Nannocystis radixulma]MDC0666092.1 L-seryl-tRNA(Sec) selenium transferase [Nannocystis radixulma]